MRGYNYIFLDYDFKMSFYIDLKYLKFVSPKLEGFTQKNPELFQTKCFYCGDSKKKKSKKRGFFYKKGESLFYRCFNCEVSTTFQKTLEYLDPYLAREYTLEKYSSGVNKHTPYKKPNFISKPPVFAKKSKLNVSSISDLPEKHYAKQYVLERKIPKGFHKDLYFAECFKKFVSDIYPSYDKDLLENDPRLIIPFRTENGDIFCFQGRALSKNPLRYVTVKMNDSSKLFGLDRINKKETIFVVESPIDSLFLKNAIATADSNLEIGAKYFEKDNKDIILIPDREPRNPHICKGIKKYIDNGRKICLFPETMSGKDINEFILNGLTKPKLTEIILENTFDGIRAELEFNKWKKV